jgi:hypothetical protein
MAELYPGLSQAWRKRLTSSREGRQDWLHSLHNNIVHYGSNRDASGRYPEAIVETAFPFLEEMFQRITRNTVSLPHLLMEWIYREVEVARLVRRDLRMSKSRRSRMRSRHSSFMCSGRTLHGHSP